MKRSPFISAALWLCLPLTRLVNRINWRFGRGYECNFKQIEPYIEYLQPGTVILTHRKYEFSTLFIPGYWTHSAVVALPGWIVEATGKGVCLNSMEAFFSTIDDFIVLKPSFCLEEIMKITGEKALQLVGYPFSFDFRNTNGMFYCSGLICWIYLQTLMDREESINIPSILQNFLHGNIIKPIDIYTQKDSWQVIVHIHD